MDDQNFDDIIKGKLENYQDTGGFDPGTLDSMLDNLPAAGGGGGGSSGGLPGWAQSAWVPIGLGATLLLNVVLITMLWTQKRTIDEVKEELKIVQAKTPTIVHDTIVVARKDTVYLKGNNYNNGLNQAGFVGSYTPYYNQKGNVYNNTSKYRRYPANTSNPPYFRAGSYYPNSQQNRQGQPTNPMNTRNNTAGNLKNVHGKSINNSGIGKNGTDKPDLTDPTKKLQPTKESLRLMASLSIDSIRLLPRMENEKPYDSWTAEVKEVPVLAPKAQKKKRKKNAFWNNVGVQLGVSAGITSPIFELGDSQVAVPLGVKAEISLGERLRIHTGIDCYRISQNIGTFPTNLDLEDQYPEINEDELLEEITMEATVIEIPVQLRYTFGGRFSNIKPFVGVGVIARKMSSQELSYSYEEEQASETYIDSSPFRLSNYQVTFGTEIYLSKSLNLQLGAYYNGGLKPLGFAESQFNNLGMNASLFFTLK